MRTLIVLLVLSISGYWWNYRRQRFNQMEAVQTDQRNTDRLIAERQKEIQRLRETLEPLRKKQEQTQSPESSPEQLEKEIAELKETINAKAAQIDVAEAEYQAAIDAVRDHAKKQTFPLIKLPSGEELVEARITNFGEGYVSISHRDGVTKVQSEDLPEGWAAKYAFDYVGREAKAENAELHARVDRAVIPPLDLKNVKLEELDAWIEQLNTQLLALTAEMRAATRKADEMTRAAYRIRLETGEKGEAAAAKRTAMFRASKDLENEREAVRKKYVVLREQKIALERRRLELKRKRV